MSVEIKKIKDIEYNEMLTIALIEKDPDLSLIYKDDFPLSFNIMKQLSKNNGLNSQSQLLLKDIFEKIILTQESMIDTYLRLAHGDEIDLNISEIADSSIVENTTKSDSLEVLNDKIAASVTESNYQKRYVNIPRRYGKKKILEDIKKQEGKITPTQNAMLKVNDLKNICVKLAERGRTEMYTGKKILTDEDCRAIVATVTILERKLESILMRSKLCQK